MTEALNAFLSGQLSEFLGMDAYNHMVVLSKTTKDRVWMKSAWKFTFIDTALYPTTVAGK